AIAEDGTLWGWGDNSSGQLGNGTNTNARTPQPIQTNVTWRIVAGGDNHTVALREDGTLWAWGGNSDGQLGNGTFTRTNTPQPIQTTVTWRAIAAGGHFLRGHTMALRADGTPWSWGSNESGELGNGTFTSSNAPQPVLTNVTWQAVAAGWSHTIALGED